MIDKYTRQELGEVEVGYGGFDRYILVTYKEGDIESERQVIDDLLPHYYYEGKPGGAFCHHMRVILDPLHENKAIAILQWRFDI